MKTSQIALFTTQVEDSMFAGLVTRETLANKDIAKSETNAVKSARVVAESKKAIALRLGIANTKENAGRIESEMLKSTDRLAQLALKELVARQQDSGWTGKSVSISKNKKGTEQTFTVSLKSCDRIGILPTAEQAAKFLATLSEDQQVALMEQAETLKRELRVTDVSSTTTEVE